MLTSISPADRYARRTWWFVYAVWAAMTLQALLYIVLYAHGGPIVIDEWEFVPAVTGEEPFWPWLWQLHNEHRFVLPRLVWLPITQLTGDFRAGCFVTLAGVSGLAMLLIRLAAHLRGRLHFADAFFSMSLLNAGNWENLRMGYQVGFALNLVLAGLLLHIVLTTNRSNLLPRGIQAAVVTLLLLACGAGGLAFGPFMAIWFVAIIIWRLLSQTRPTERGRIALLLVLAIMIPAYIWLYVRNYERPSYHPDPIAVWGSLTEALLQSLRVALQVLSMSFGQAATGLWPVSALIVGVVLFECLRYLAQALFRQPDDRPRTLGLLLFLGSIVFMALGVGWGRCGFTDNGKPGTMGLVSRYSWIAWPALGAIYFQWMIYGSERLARFGPIVLFGISLLMLPFNVASGFIQGQSDLAYQQAWEKSVRSGMSDQELIQEYFPDYDARLRKRMEVALHLLRKHRIQYYRP